MVRGKKIAPGIGFQATFRQWLLLVKGRARVDEIFGFTAMPA